MTNEIFEALPGEGKTLIMVKRLLQGHHSGYTVVTNLKLTGIPYIPFKLQLVKDAMDNDLDLNQIYGAEKIAMGLDEIVTIADGRRALTSENITLSYLFMQARKRKTHIFGTLQNWDDLEKRARKLVNWRTQCKRQGSMKHPIAFHYLRTHRQYRYSHYEKITAAQASLLYRLYDTWQPINPQSLRKK